MDMKRVFSSLIIVLCLAACGGKATPGPTEVARAVEATLTARARWPTTGADETAQTGEEPARPPTATQEKMSDEQIAPDEPAAAAPSPPDSPELAAREWLLANLNLDGIALTARTCKAHRQHVMSDAALASAMAMIVGRAVEGSIAGVGFDTVVTEADRAQVKVSGETTVAVLGTASTSSVNQTWEMVLEDGTWRWCGQAGACAVRGWQPVGVDRGWMGIPVAVSKTATGSGWADLEIDLALRNDTGSYSRMYAGNNQRFRRGRAWVTTDEGYSYECRFNMVESLPPGFQAPPDSGDWITCEVAETTSGYRLHVKYGYWLGLDAPDECEKTGEFAIELEEREISYPVAYQSVPMNMIGDVIRLGGSDIIVTSAIRVGQRIDIEWFFANRSKGYGNNCGARIGVWLDNGRAPEGEGGQLSVGEEALGPGQVKSFSGYFDGIPEDVRVTHLSVGVPRGLACARQAYILDLEGKNAVTSSNSLARALADRGSMLIQYDGGWGARVMNADGGGVTELTDLDTEEYGLMDWSPDMQQLVFSSWRDEGNYDIYVSEMDPTEARKIADVSPRDWGPRWSPDGRRIVFASDFVVYVVNSDGSELHRVSVDREEGFDNCPAWSPDGSTIAYASTDSEMIRIWLHNVETGIRSLLLEEEGEVGSVCVDDWSPNGRHLALTVNGYDGNGDIYVLGIDGPPAETVIWDPSDDCCARWSPDGEVLAFTSDRYRPGYYEGDVFVTSIDGSRLMWLTSEPGTEWVASWRR